MALDPSISLAVRPPAIPIPQIQTPIEQFGQILTLRNLMTQGQLGQIGLQSKQLELEQLQREMKERQGIADWLARAVGGGSATPAATAAPVIPPVQATPAGGTVTQTGPAVITPSTFASAVAPSQDTTIAPNFGLTPAATPAGAPAAQDGTGLGGFNLGEFLSRFPNLGPTFAKNLLGAQQAQSEAAIKQHDANIGIADELSRAGIAVRDSKDPATQFVTELTKLGNNGRLPWPTVRQMIADGYDKHKNDVQGFIDNAQNVKDHSETVKTDLESLGTAQKNAAATIGDVSDQASYDRWYALQDRRIQAELGPTYHPGLNNAVQAWGIPPADRYEKSMQKTAQDAQFLTNSNQIPDFIAAQPAERRAYLQKLSETVPLDKFKELLGVASAVPKPGETVPLPAGVQAQKVEQIGAQGLAAAQAQITAKNNENTALAGAVIRDPNLYSKLSPEKQSELQPFLARLGFTQFTIKPSDTELTTLYNNQRNLDAVKAMRDDFNSGKYDWITGPVLGHAKSIPYLGDNGKVLEGKLDELRSTLGDLVKGGTLRSSDIPIYEKMFPNVTDTTAVIKGKLTNLYDRLESDVTRYRSVLKSSGRALPDEEGPVAPTGPPAGSGEAPPGSTPALKRAKPTDEPVMVWYGPDGKEYSKPPAVQTSPAKKPPASANPNPNGYIKGHKYGGLTYLGGDPNVRSSWQ